MLKKCRRIISCSTDCIYFVFIILLSTDRGCSAVGECRKDGNLVATVTQEVAVLGSKDNGFRIRCNYTLVEDGHTLSLWRLQKSPTEFILSHVPPTTVAEGTDYAGRGLTFEDKSAVFPSYVVSDISKLTLTCYLSLDTLTITCTDAMQQNIYATPAVTVVTEPPDLSSVSHGTNVTMTITGTDYSCSEVPTFTVKIGTGPARPLTLTPPATSGVFSTFTASVTFTVSSTESGKVEGTMMCGGDSTPFVVPVTLATTTTPTPTPTTTPTPATTVDTTNTQLITSTGQDVITSTVEETLTIASRPDYGETGACSAGGGTLWICSIVLVVVKWKFPRSEKSQEKKHSKKWKLEHADTSSTEYKDLVKDFEIEVKRSDVHMIYLEVKSVKRAEENNVEISYDSITSPHVKAKGILHLIVSVLSVICILLGVICLITVLAATNCPLDQTNCKVNLALAVVVLLLGAACLAFSWLLRDYHYDWRKYGSNRGQV